MQLKSISLNKFLKLYLGIENEVLKKMTHNDVKILLPDLCRCSFEYAYENCEMVLKGDIIIVSDAKGMIVPYLKPHEKMQFNVGLIYANETKKVAKITTDKENIKLKEMSNYELKLLLNVSKNGYAVSNSARKELEERGNVKPKQKVKKRVCNNYYLRNCEEE